MTDLCSSLEHVVWFAAILDSLKNKYFYMITIIFALKIWAKYGFATTSLSQKDSLWSENADSSVKKKFRVQQLDL